MLNNVLIVSLIDGIILCIEKHLKAKLNLIRQKSLDLIKLLKVCSNHFTNSSYMLFLCCFRTHAYGSGLRRSWTFQSIELCMCRSSLA